MNYLNSNNKFIVDGILKPHHYDYISSFSMTYYGLVFLINEILINKRRNIIEFGCGMSTITMATLVKSKRLPTKITSIENDLEWYHRLKNLKEIDDLGGILEVIYVPLQPSLRLGNSNKWYDVEILRKQICSKEKFDTVIIDGPPAYDNSFCLSRFGAVPFIYDYLDDNYSIFLDDATRYGERSVMDMWKNEFGVEFSIYDNRIAVCRKGGYACSMPNLVINLSLYQT